ncbi:hypothetical protein MN086_04055 [Sulfurovum sp. XGS-02]|uniref:hypothetical protein n=1 Tax=Sulfurovum sp. XGS-02 TaxID=2925411 RepID=UPI0020688C6E|nr:hypothetical protein [Sulfurovum sp. XGS-02]UPT78322.1 hypothetical protein MN086_04055 [Sulfurovum sp. XGS-02]
MSKTLIIVGLGIAYLSWIQKKEIEYIEKKNHENAIGTESVINRRNRVKDKLLNNEKLTVSEWCFWYSYTIMSSALKYGLYGGLILSSIGIILLIIK